MFGEIQKYKLAQINVAQHRVHLTCGSLRGLGAFFWLRVFSTSQSLSTPAHTQVTQTVGRLATSKEIVNGWNIMLKNIEIKKEIYVSVIVTILTIVFIDPILKFIWGGMIWFGTTSYQGFLNSMYKNAALGHRNYIDVIIFWFLCSTFIGIAMGVISWQVNKNLIPVEKINKSPRLKKFFIVLIMVLWIIGTLREATSAFVDLQLNASFQQRLTVLAPKISEQEHKELSASWANMQNRSDYELIVMQMDTLAQQNNIVLPELLLK